MLVVDASVALKWFLAEQDAARARLIALRDDLIAPELIVAEVANALWKASRRNQIDAADADAALATLIRTFQRTAPVADRASDALQIAGALDHPVYDCFYLALARREGAILVTADRRLLARLAGTPWANTVQDLATWTAT